MDVNMIKMSSKGQIVIPRGIRAEICASEGTIFAVVSGKDSIVLKKVVMPSKEELICELQKIAKEGANRTERRGIKESDVPDIVHGFRKDIRKARGRIKKGEFYNEKEAKNILGL